MAVRQMLIKKGKYEMSKRIRKLMGKRIKKEKEKE